MFIGFCRSEGPQRKNDGETNCSQLRTVTKRLEKKTNEIENQRENRDHPD